MLRGELDPGFMVEHFVKDMAIALAEARRRAPAAPAAWHRGCLTIDSGGYSDGTDGHTPRSRECGRRVFTLGSRADCDGRLHGEPRPRAPVRDLQGLAVRSGHPHGTLN